MGCPSPEVLAALRAGSLPADAAKEVEAHLQGCPTCSPSDAEARTKTEETASTVAARGHTPRRSPSPARLGPGTVVGRYVVVSELGQGGMGAVYAAYDPQLDRKLALKLLHVNKASTRSAAEAAVRLQREAQALARVSHPNTVAIYDVGTHDGRVFLAMEHLKGVTLRPWLEQEPRPWREAVRVCVEAGKGLAAVHAAGLVHRDFKPANVIVTPDGAVKVLDFGLARLSNDSPQERSEPELSEEDFEFPSGALETPLTEEGSLSGTPGYVAPELLSGHPATTASDQFAFGVTLHLALYGTRPYNASSFEEMLGALAKGLPASPPAGAKAPRRLYQVVRRCLAPRPIDRYPSMHEALAALQRDPARVWRRWAFRVGAVAAVVLAAVVSARLSRVECPTEASLREGLWSATTRARLSTALTQAAPAAAADIATAMSAIDDRVGDWAMQSAQTCVAAASRQATAFDARRAVCLRRREQGMRLMLDALGRADPFVAAHVNEVAIPVFGNATCDSEADFLRMGAEEVAPESSAIAADLRAGVLRSRGLLLSSRREEAMTEARTVVARAQDAGLAGYVAEGLQVAAWLDWAPGYEERATDDLARAVEQALAAGADGRAFFMLENLLRRYSPLSEHLPEARLGLRVMEGLWARLGRSEYLEFSLILLRQDLAEAEGRPEEEDDRALARGYEIAARTIGTRSLELADVATRWSWFLWRQGKVTESNRLDAQALSIEQELRHPDDPLLAPYILNRAQGLGEEGRNAEGIALIDQTLAAVREGARAEEWDTADLETVLSALLRGSDDARAVSTASTAIAHAQQRKDDEKLRGALLARAAALLAVGRPRDALADCQGVAHLIEQLPRPDEEDRRNGKLCLGEASAALKDHRAALKAFEEAEALGPKYLLPTTRARLDLGLARALRATHGDAARARQLARDALEALAAPGFVKERAEVQAFLDGAD